MEATIIIPTYNRIDLLKRCLNSLKMQTFKDFEVIIVDDGSSDDTKEIIKNIKGLKIKYIHQDHKQQGAARNKGILKARGKYVFFIGDDIFPTKNWLYEHIKIHKENKNIAVLGLTVWHPDLKINNFMKYLAPNGPQFNYGLIKNKRDCGWGFFWTSNLSLEGKWLKEDKFDEVFKGWGYEDLELGYRLEKKGLKIIYNKDALVYHNHYYKTPESFLEKQENMARSALYFAEKFPELKGDLIEKNKLKDWQKMLYMVYRLFPLLQKMKKTQIIYWKLLRRVYFTRGLKRK